jgi:hypothetical protein
MARGDKGAGKGGTKGDVPVVLSQAFDHGMWIADGFQSFSGSGRAEPRSMGRVRNELTTSNLPVQHYSHNSPFGGFGRFTAANNSAWDIETNVADSISELFIVAVLRIASGGGSFPIGRGVAGWSMQCVAATNNLWMRVITTAGTSPGDKVADAGAVMPFGRWTTAMWAYKANSYVKVGLDGVWLATTNHSSNTLRNDASGLSIGRFGGSSSGQFDGDIAFVGFGTAIPSDNQLLSTIMAVQAAGSPPSGNQDDGPTIIDLDVGGATRGGLLLLGAG